MRTGHNHNHLLAALAALLAAVTLRAVTLEDLERMCNAGRDEYTALRTAIVAEGESALPFLDATLADETKPWKVRFMAGVCTDHIRHGKEIEAFLKHDWQQDPDCQKFWKPAPYISAAGFPTQIIPVFFRRMDELGTWFFFIEVYLALDKHYYAYGIYRWIPDHVVKGCVGPARFFAAKWAEERSRDYFSGKVLYGGSFVDDLREFALDGTYPEGADLFLAHPGRCGSETLAALVQVTTNLPLLLELKARNPNLIYRPGFAARIDELQRRQDEAEAAARAARAETEAAARATLAEGEAADRTARAVLILLAVAATADLLAALLLRRRYAQARKTNDK